MVGSFVDPTSFSCYRRRLVMGAEVQPRRGIGVGSAAAGSAPQVVLPIVGIVLLRDTGTEFFDSVTKLRMRSEVNKTVRSGNPCPRLTNLIWLDQIYPPFIAKVVGREGFTFALPLRVRRYERDV